MKLIKLMTGGAICAAVVFALGNSTTQAQNLLVDPGFESNGSAVGDWATFNGANFSTTVARTGTFSMANPGGNVTGSFETFATTPGLEYDLTGFGLIPTALTGGDGQLQITFFSGANGSGANLGSINISNGGTPTGAGNAQVSNLINATSPIGQWIPVDTGIAQAPAGAASLQVFTLAVFPVGSTVYFDDLSLVQVVPEPSTLALAGIALGIPFYFIRRRNS
jgi:PEP-CTERM motif